MRLSHEQEAALWDLAKHFRSQMRSAEAMWDNPMSGAYWDAATRLTGILMSSPMWDLPEHFPIGVDKGGNGPTMPDSPDYVGEQCWCGDDTCVKYLLDQG